MISNRGKRISRPWCLNWARALALSLTAFLFLNAAPDLTAQLKSAAPETHSDPAKVVDPLGRETPRSAFVGFLKYAEREDFATAARYLQPAPGQDTTELVQRLKELRALRSKFKGDIDLLSDEPNGSVEAGLPLGEVRAGVIEVGSTTVDVVLVRVNDPDSGKIWLISKDTVASVPQLYAQMESEGPTAAERFVPAALRSRRLLDMSLAQWLEWLLSIPISWFLAWLLEFLISAPRRIWRKLRKLPFDTIWKTALGMPLRCIVAILV